MHDDRIEPQRHGQAIRRSAVAARPAAPRRRGSRRRPGSLGARLRNYFLTGLIIVGPVTITLYIIWWFINVTDAWIKPFVPTAYLPETYLPFPVPGFGLMFGIMILTLIGALTANLLGRSLISFGEMMLDRMPIVRNVYRALKQIFESVVSSDRARRRGSRRSA